MSATSPKAVADSTVGRNDLCPCGSKKKFKKCCIDKLVPSSAAFTPLRPETLQHLLDTNRAAEAVAMAQKHIEQHPQDARAMSMLGDIYLHLGHSQAALAAYGQAMRADPKLVDPYLNRGLTYARMNDHVAAAADFGQATVLAPNNPAGFMNRAVSLYLLADYANTITSLTRVIALNPDAEKAWLLLANAHDAIGQMDIARTVLIDAVKKYPRNPVFKLTLAFLLPAITTSNAEIDRLRAQLLGNIDQLLQENFLVQDVRSTLSVPFYQGYHGRDDTAFMTILAEFFLRCCPSLNFSAPHCLTPPLRKDKIRIGFVSQNFQGHLIMQFYGDIIEALTQNPEFEVILFSIASPDPRAKDEVISKAHKHLLLPTNNPVPARQIIANEEVDMLVYCEVNMSVSAYCLALARLAPIQIVLPGHPITTGIPAMDYFISGRSMEPEGAQAHYTEKLVLCDKTPFAFRRKDVPALVKSREELGLPTGDVHLYACPVLLFKLHPDMDTLLVSILERDPKARIVLFDSKHKLLWRSQLQERFAVSMPPELVHRIDFLPFTKGDDFFHLLRSVDCILDPCHYSFGTTACLLLGAHIPFVTMAGAFLRGRVAYGLYTDMGVPDLIASTPEHYVELALRLASDVDFRQEVTGKIRKTSNRIFDRDGVIHEFTQLFKTLYAAADKTS